MDEFLALSDPELWARTQFEDADLGDARRTKRLVTTAALMAVNSSGTIPQQAGSEAAARGRYRLFSMEDVTHEAVCAPHLAQTRGLASSLPLVYLVQDTTELNYTLHDVCEGLAPIGHGGQMKGMHQQNVLAIAGDTGRPLGLMHQRHYKRVARPKAKSKCKRRAAQRRVPAKERESHWWIDSIEAIGTPPPDTRWVHVGDRGEDVFGVYAAARKTGADWLIRVAHDRCVKTPEGKGRLFAQVRALPAIAVRTVTVRNAERQGDVELCIAAGRTTLLPASRDCATRDEAPIDCYMVRAWEPKPPKGVKPIEWILCTSLPCEDAEGATRAEEAYSKRWLIEELHKCEKTGCQVEMRRLESTDRLEPLIGLLSVLAVFLLQLKLVARENPDAKATEMFVPEMVEVMAARLKKPASTLTVGAFSRGIGLLGGHLGRRQDGPIGWLRAWRGWQAFQLIVSGAAISAEVQRRREAKT